MCVLNTVGEGRVSPLIIFVTQIEVFCGVMASCLRSKERIQIVEIDGAEEDNVKDYPQTQTNDQEYGDHVLNCIVIAFALVELQCDERKELRPNHTQAEGQAPELVRMPEVKAPTEVHDHLARIVSDRETNRAR